MEGQHARRHRRLAAIAALLAIGLVSVGCSASVTRTTYPAFASMSDVVPAHAPADSGAMGIAPALSAAALGAVALPAIDDALAAEASAYDPGTTVLPAFPALPKAAAARPAAGVEDLFGGADERCPGGVCSVPPVAGECVGGACAVPPAPAR